MEFFALLLSGLLGLLTPVGLLIDRTAAKAIRSQFAQVGELQVRIDNTPSHQLLQGKVEQLRIAGRSLRLKRLDLQIAALELETDEIQFKLPSLSQGRPKFNRPLQAGLRLVLTQQDINRFLQSPEVTAQLRQLNINIQNASGEDQRSLYNFTNLSVNFLANNRLAFQVELQANKADKPLLIAIESGLTVIDGKQIQLVNPTVALNGEEVPPQVINVIFDAFNQRLDLSSLEGDGLQLQILKLNIKPSELEIATFVRIEPSAKFWETPNS